MYSFRDYECPIRRTLGFATSLNKPSEGALAHPMNMSVKRCGQVPNKVRFPAGELLLKFAKESRFSFSRLSC
jgi:hypothetical protein